MKFVAVVQARLGSTRLPGKVVLPVAGAPMLARLIERVRAAHEVDEIVVATTTAPEDDRVAGIAAEAGTAVYRGHATDLLDRHVRAAGANGADVVVKIPSDCPLIDPAVIDLVLARCREAWGTWDFAGNLHPATWPDGNDVEAVPFPLLEAASAEATKPYEREHTTPFFWDRPDRFRLLNVLRPDGRDLSRSHRFTVDYREDYELVRSIYEELWSPGRVFGTEEILDLLDRRPELHALNARFAGVNWYRHHLHELQTIGAGETRNPEDPLP